MATYNRWYTQAYKGGSGRYSFTEMSEMQESRKRVMLAMMFKNGEIQRKPEPRVTSLSTEEWLNRRQQERAERRG